MGLERKENKRCCGENNSFYGKRHTEETKHKMSEWHQAHPTCGIDNGMFGRTHTKEQKEKWSAEREGRTLSEETKQKMRKPKSAETRKRMSKPKSAEHRANISKALKGNQRGLGYRHTEDALEKIRARQRDSKGRFI